MCGRTISFVAKRCWEDRNVKTKTGIYDFMFAERFIKTGENAVVCKWEEKKGHRTYLRCPLAFCNFLLLVRLHALNGTVCVVLNLSEHNTTLMVNTAGKGRVMVEQVPLVVPLYDGVMGGPSDNRL